MHLLQIRPSACHVAQGETANTTNPPSSGSQLYKWRTIWAMNNLKFRLCAFLLFIPLLVPSVNAQDGNPRVACLDTMAINSDYVFVGIIVNVRKSITTEHDVDVTVERWLKGKGEIGKYATTIANVGERVLTDWKTNGSRVLIFQLPSNHSTVSTGIMVNAINLSDPDLKVLTANMQLLRDPQQVLRATENAINRHPGIQRISTVMRTLPDDIAAAFGHPNQKDRTNELADLVEDVPVDADLERWAQSAVVSKRDTERQDAARALGYFPSDANAALLKRLLDDPAVMRPYYRSDLYYFVRDTARDSLKRMGRKAPQPVSREETIRPLVAAVNTVPTHLLGARLAPTGENSAWVWGIENGQFALLNTSDQGRSWSTCYLPAALGEFVQNERTLLKEDDQNFMHEIPLSPSFPDANNVWLTWTERTKEDLTSRIVTAHSTDQCQSWNLVTAFWPHAIPPDHFPDIQYLTTQFNGQNGWALVSEDPATGTCPQAFLKTVDAGRSWQWTPFAPDAQNSPPINCPLSEWHYDNPEESWLSHPNYTGEYSRIFWKTTDGGQSWKNLSAQIKLPESIPGSNSFIRSMSLPAFSPTNSNIGTLGIIFNHATEEEVNRSRQHEVLAIYRTTDAGKSWQLSKVSENFPDAGGRLTFQDDLHGFFCVYHSVDKNTVDTSLDYTSDGGFTWTKHKLPAGLDPESVILKENKLWAVTNTKNETQQSSLMISTDGGSSWQDRQIGITPQPYLKITFAHPPDAPPTFGGGLPREAQVPQPGWDTKGHGALADIVANRVSSLKVTWSDPARFKSEAQTEELLRLLLTSSKTEMMTYHVWSWGDNIPNVIATVEHKTGKPGRLVLWCPPPGLYWAYQDGDGKWSWGYWDVREFGLPTSVIPLVMPGSGFVHQDFDVQMRLSKPEFILGEPVWVDVQITNRSTETFRIDTSPYCFMFNRRPLNIQIPAADPGIAERDRRCNEQPGGSCMGTWADLAPDETFTRRYVLSGDFRITHPDKYRVLLEKPIPYTRTPDAPAEGPAEKFTQTARSELTLNVLPANPEKLLAIERTLAEQAEKPVVIPPVVAIRDGRPISTEEYRRADDDRRKRDRETSEAHHAISEGLAAYPAAGMEPIFRAWLDRGDLESSAMLGLYHLNTKDAREVLAQLASSTGKPDDSVHQNHRLAAVSELARMDDKSYVPLLEKLARDANDGVSQQAILGLGMLGGENELPFLTALAREGATASHRKDAIISMGDTASLKAVPILLDCFKLPDVDAPTASIIALSRLTHHQIPNAEHRTPLEVQAAWQDWWKQNQRTARAYRPFECSAGNAQP